MKPGSNYNAHMIALAEQAAEQLQGTCRSIVELGEEIEDAFNEQSFCNRLDELVFECERCNWWYEISEMSEQGWFCIECEDK